MMCHSVTEKGTIHDKRFFDWIYIYDFRNLHVNFIYHVRNTGTTNHFALIILYMENESWFLSFFLWRVLFSCITFQWIVSGRRFF